MRVVFESPAGKEVMQFLEAAVGYDASIFDPKSKENTWVQDGKRQVVATIKSFLKLEPEAIMQLVKQEE
jgi:predicted SnoaL-like aldol condensation-catalyzing enzyme